MTKPAGVRGKAVMLLGTLLTLGGLAVGDGVGSSAALVGILVLGLTPVWQFESHLRLPSDPGVPAAGTPDGRPSSH